MSLFRPIGWLAPTASPTRPLLPLFSMLLVALAPPLVHAQTDRPATAVIASDAERQTWSDPLEALGTVRADESVTLSATVTEIIRAVHFNDGERVEQGDLLVHLEDLEEQAELAAAQARLVEQRNVLARARDLAERNLGARAELEDARARVQQSQAEIEAAQARLADHRIHAPFDGVVGLREISPGMLVSPGTALVRLDKLDMVDVDFTVPSRYLGAISRGQTITASTDAYPDRRFSGRVTGIDNRIDPATRSIALRARIDNDDGALRPGQLMQTTLERDRREVVAVPESVLLPQGEQQYLFVIDRDAMNVERREVEIGERREGWVEVTGGLEPGERLVRHGIQKVRDGDAVRVLAVADEDNPIREILRRHRDTLDSPRDAP
ncbi:MAG: efflux RND transporter periplasmic adaptor subunit [Halothiobacillaceae bacterium]|nr:efflux RND transporter periplasmic adaptor subunit [Halothiobacillaceae bacterium]